MVSRSVSFLSSLFFASFEVDCFVSTPCNAYRIYSIIQIHYQRCNRVSAQMHEIGHVRNDVLVSLSYLIMKLWSSDIFFSRQFSLIHLWVNKNLNVSFQHN